MTKIVKKNDWDQKGTFVKWIYEAIELDYPDNEIVALYRNASSEEYSRLK